MKAVRLTPLLVFLSALSVYAATAPRTLTWAHAGGDGGELIAAAATLGVPHPPGYPLYTLLGHLVFRLPGGTPAFRFHLFSSATMAAAAAIIALTLLHARRGGLNPAAAGAAALTYALAPLVWSQAIIAEVYALNALAVALLVWSLRTDRPVFWRALFLGVAAHTHLTSLLLLPWTAATVWGELRQRPTRRGATLWACACGGTLGLLPLAALPLLAAGSSPVVWGEPSTLRGWWWLVSGQLYQPNVLALPTAQWGERLASWGPQLASQFSWITLPLILYGAASAPRSARRDIAWLCAGGAAYVLYAAGYRTGDAIIYILPALLLLSQVLAFGLRRPRGGALLLPLLLLALHFGRFNLRADQAVATRAEIVLTAAPEGAILLTPGDQSLFTLWYYQLALQQRPDLLLVDSQLLAFDWYRARLLKLHPQLRALEQDDVALFTTTNRQRRPLCHAALQAVPPLSCDPAGAASSPEN